jgi:hypothetical protein
MYNNYYLIFFIITLLIINPIAKNIVYNNGKNINHLKLPDIVHNNINHQYTKQIGFINNIFPSLIIFFTIYNVLTKNIMFNDLYLLLKYITIALLIKIVLMNSTVLPDISGKCLDDTKYKNKLYFYFMSGCNDLIFSFHMATVLFCLHILKKNNVIDNDITIILSIVQALLILLSKSHYTVDVLISFIVVPFVINEKYFI